MRKIVVGDIHGCYSELKILIEELKAKGKYNHKQDRLIFLGDYIDRGDDSREVIKYVRELERENKNVIALMGNHEDMLLEYFDNGSRSWLYNGYQTTIDSYKGYDEEFLDDIYWMNNLPLYFEDDNFIYVHAGINKSLPTEKQSKDTLLWIREAFYRNKKRNKKTVIFGHTPTELMVNRKHTDSIYDKPLFNDDNSIGIDTGCVFGGMLTALIINNDKVEEYYQVKKGVYIMRKEKVNNEWKTIVAQAFYGNRVLTEIKDSNVDRFILGYTDDKTPLSKNEKIDRTIMKIEEDNNLVIMYNKYEEEQIIEDAKKHSYKPLAINPETGEKLYSRCIGCRVDDNGNLCNLEEGDVKILKKYLVA